MKKDPELYEVFDYFRKVLIDELDNADIETTEGQTIKTAVVTAAEKVCSQFCYNRPFYKGDIFGRVLVNRLSRDPTAVFLSGTSKPYLLSP